MRRRLLIFILIELGLLVSACQAAKVCPEGSVTYQADPNTFPPLALPVESVPTEVEIGGRLLTVDRVITGPICNDVWRGTIYVGCQIQLVEWNKEAKPTFFKDCNLTIEPDTVVYVAAHNDAAYYKGCSCHTGGGGE